MTVWRKAKCNTGACVEVFAHRNHQVELRDSKDPEGPTLLFTQEEFGIFIKGAKSGDFDDLL